MAKPQKIRNSWRLYFRYQGKTYRRFYIKNKQQAIILQNRVDQIVAELKYGLIQIPDNTHIDDFVFNQLIDNSQQNLKEVTRKITLQILIDEFTQTSQPPQKTKETIRIEQIHIRHLKRFLAEQTNSNPQIEDITIGFFNSYKSYRYRKNIKTDTVNKELGTFQLIFKQAVENAYINYNIVKEVKRDKSQIPSHRFHTHQEIQELLQTGQYSQQEIQELKRYRYLTAQEIQQIIDLAQNKWLYRVLITYANTGIRRGELPNIEWKDVNLEKRFLIISSKKQSRSRQNVNRRIAINDKLLQCLQEQHELTADKRWVFVNKKGEKLSVNSLTGALRRLLKGTEFEGIGYHVFRHSFASNLAAAGVDQRTIDRLVGHQTKEMRERYQHLFPQQLHDAVNLL